MYTVPLCTTLYRFKSAKYHSYNNYYYCRTVYYNEYRINILRLPLLLLLLIYIIVHVIGYLELMFVMSA